MAQITAKDVAALRAKTGLGMMDCKKALVEADGDIEQAVKILREKGLATAAKKESRIAAEGVVDILVENNVAAMIEVNTETDFVAKNEKFREFVKGVLKTIIDTRPSDVEDLKTKSYLGTASNVDAALTEKIAQIGEKISIRRFDVVEGVMSTYIHGMGQTGVIVKFNADDAAVANEGFAEFAKNIALQIAAGSPPSYVCRDEVPASALEEEKSVLLAQIKNDEKNANKPEAILEKMIMGKLGKFYERVCLVDQAYVKDDKISVGKYIADTAKELGGDITVEAFYLYERGEGLEKKEENFGDEIASMLK